MTVALRDNSDDHDDNDRGHDDGGERRPAVVDAELVPAKTAAPTAGRRVIDATATVRRKGVAVVTTAAAHPHTRRGLAAGLTVLQGFESWGKRAYDASTMGTYRRAVKAAELAGDREALGEWADRYEKARSERHKRLMDAPKLAFGLAKALGGGLVGLVTLVLVLALVAQLSGVGSFLGVLSGVLALIGFVAAVVAFLWTPLLAALPGLVVVAAYREGKRRGSPPAWAATSADEADISIDETTIAQALSALRIPQITTYLKQGMPLQFLTPARVDGRGTHAVIRLPSGVAAEKIARRRADLATGLHRLSKEVWPTTGAEAGILDLWVADKGALAEGAGPYPLLDDGVVDVFRGVPFGKTLRGAPLTGPVMERNTLTGGMPGQGKSSAARVVMVGAALDPTAELRIWVPDANFDFEAFRPRCSRYVMGAEDERIEEILNDLRELHAEVQRRGELLVRYEIPSVTREYASKDVGLHPLFCLLEEAHVACQHPKHGGEIGKLLVEIMRLGRKRAIHLVVSTQAPTKDSIPRDVTRNASNGVAFAVGDHVANDALLGQGAYTAGHRATELIPGTDRGTAVVKGFSGQRSEIVQLYFLDVARENDQVTPIIDRAMDAIERRGAGLPGAGQPTPVVEASRDLLDDLDQVMGNDPVPAADLPALLAAHAPRWVPYKSLTGKALRARLADEYGIKVPSTGNKYPVDPVTVRTTLARQSTADLDDDDLADG